MHYIVAPDRASAQFYIDNHIPIGAAYRVITNQHQLHGVRAKEEDTLHKTSNWWKMHGRELIEQRLQIAGLVEERHSQTVCQACGQIETFREAYHYQSSVRWLTLPSNLWINLGYGFRPPRVECSCRHKWPKSWLDI